MAIEAERAKDVPVLVLDAGNALFKYPAKGADPTEKARAELILKQMDAMGTVAMAAGARDLTLGLDFLKSTAKGAKMKVLSANLVDKAGKAVFPASTVATVAGLKFGIVGASPEGALPDCQGQPAAPAVLAEAKRLREKEKVDVVVVLAAMPYDVARKLASQAEGVDFVIQSHEGRGTGVAYRDGLAVVIPPGERGRQVARLELAVSGPGTFQDLNTAGQAKENLKNLEANLNRAKERLVATQDPAARKALEETIATFEARRTALQKEAKLDATGLARTHQLSYIQLGTDKPSDPTVQKLVERIEPAGSGHH
ncbi:5'-nucleotidase [Hyalangium versicolor]|uniref:5'-nucleotidase n=1 Tax=Hyalangium versicolor TaxID=2861190 RepID=UPI001CC95756|nr:5'-nucleotidase [Hyalangium versicolor]